MVEPGPRHRYDSVASITKTNTLYGRRYTGIPSNPLRSSEITSVSTVYGPSSSKSMDDVVTLDFRERIAAGEIINNPMSLFEEKTIYPQPTPYFRSMLKSYYSGTKKVVTGDQWNGSHPMSVALLGSLLAPGLNPDRAAEISSLKQQAIAAAHSNASSDEISLLMVAGEGRETVESIKSILLRVYKIARAARRADLRYLKKQMSFKELSDRYMELRYALRPLAYDAVGTVNAWNTSTDEAEKRMTFRGYKTHSYEESDTIPYTSWNATGTIRRTGTIETVIRAGVLTDVKISGLSVWGLDKFFETGLELIPFSFILGWFVNIGDTLASWTPKAGIRKLASWVTIESLATMTNTLVDIKNLPNSSFNEANDFSWSGSYTRTERWKTREVDPVRAVLPTVTVKLDVLKLIDLTLILRQFRPKLIGR